MGPSEARDLMFAGAGILWGTVTVFRGMRLWRKDKMTFPAIVVVGAALAISCFGYLVAHAEDAKPTQDLNTYLEQLQLKLDHTAQRANQPTSTGSSVVGLRGSKQEPLSKQLYWKGKTGPAPVTPDEVKMFRTAIEQAQAGEKDKAVATLNSFVQKYPKSGLRGDADDTLKLLASAPAPAVATPAKS